LFDFSNSFVISGGMLLKVFFPTCIYISLQ
jgi:hypothetical protein